MRPVECKFNPAQSVITPLGQAGSVAATVVIRPPLFRWLAFDDSGIVYYIKTACGGNWFDEKQLRAV